MTHQDGADRADRAEDDTTVPQAALAGVREELQRADGKAGHLTGIAGAGLAVVANMANGQHGPARWLAIAAIAVLAVVIVLAVLVIAPRLLGLVGFDAHHNASAEDVAHDLLTAERGPWFIGQYRVLSGIARGKYVLLRLACLLFILAVAVVAVAAVVTLL